MHEKQHVMASAQSKNFANSKFKGMNYISFKQVKNI
jgi:hypothetical protein